MNFLAFSYLSCCGENSFDMGILLRQNHFILIVIYQQIWVVGYCISRSLIGSIVGNIRLSVEGRGVVESNFIIK